MQEWRNLILTNTFNKNKYEDIKKLITTDIQDLLKQEQVNLSEFSINNLAVHLAMAVVRIQNNSYIPLSKSHLTLDSEDITYKIGLSLINQINYQFSINVPQLELGLISKYLSVQESSLEDVNTGLDLIDDEIIDILNQTSKKLKERYNKEFKSSQKMYITIGLHLIPAIDRLLSNNQEKSNPLLEKIKNRHPRAFDYSKALNEAVKEKYAKEFNDDELGYIALHFQVARNNDRKIG